MKRSAQVRLVLLGGITTVFLPGCGDQASPGLPRPGVTHANDHQAPGYGYYHAPYRDWYPQPYNQRDPKTGKYFHGGQWTDAPHASIVNLSEPLPDARALVASQVRRGGFGSTSRSSSHFFSS